MEVHDILVTVDGDIRFVHSDLLDGLFVECDRVTKRASHVEPMREYGFDGNGWVADMRPSGGPILLGPHGQGYPTRQAALDAERDWLRAEHNL